MHRPTVLLADDHPGILEQLQRLLQDHVDVVDAVSDAGSLIDAALRLRPDVIVTDISMPGMSGIEALRRLKAQRADTRVIILTMHADPLMAEEAMRAGASGFILKQSAGEELTTAIDEALQGRVYLTRHLAPARRGQVGTPAA